MTLHKRPCILRNGRPTKIGTPQLSEIVHLLIYERLSPRQIAKQLGVSHMTVYRAFSDPRMGLLL